MGSATESVRAVRVHENGGAEVLTLDDVQLDRPGPGQVLVEVAAAGVNFIDVYQRDGLYPLDLPLTLGMEGAGTVLEAGPDAALAPGDRVAWLDQHGSYAERAVLPADRLVPVPDGLGLDVAAAVMLQGATADYLVRDTFPLAAGQTALVHAAAGGVGLLLVQLAKALGARVVGTVGTDDKAEAAAAAGADEVINYREVDFAEEVVRRLGEHPVDVVYDGVGQATFEGGLSVLRPRGLMVSFGNASGAVEPVAPLRLSQGGSLFLTRPTLFHYVASTQELRERAGRVLAAAADGSLKVHIGHRFPLAEAAAAHRLLTSRGSSGKVLLKP